MVGEGGEVNKRERERERERGRERGGERRREREPYLSERKV